MVVLIELIGFEPEKVLIISPAFVLLAVISFIIGLLLFELSWLVLMGFLGDSPSFFSTFKAMMIGLFVDNLFPPIGPSGELTMGYVLHREDSRISLDNSMASITAQMFCWAAGFVILTLSVLLWAASTFPINEILLIMIFVLLGIFLAVMTALGIFMVNPNKVRRPFIFIITKIIWIAKRIGLFKERTEKELLEKAILEFESFGESVRPFTKEKKTLLTSASIMVAHHVFIGLTLYFAAVGVGIEAPLSALLLFFLVTNLVSWFSFTPGGLGVFEFSSIALISTTAPLTLALTAVGIFRLIQYWGETFVGSFFAIKYEMRDLYED